MPDMLVKLYEICDGTLHDERPKAEGITIRRAMVPEMHIVSAFVLKNFGKGWENECKVALTNQPVSCYIATRGQELLGFACYDATFRNYFGPTGVLESERGKGIGTSLMYACLNDMYAMGYGYCIIGWAGPIAYYEKAVGAKVIEDSSPGMYRGMLREKL